MTGPAHYAKAEEHLALAAGIETDGHDDSMSELYPSGPSTPVTDRPARCACTGPVTATLAETLGCPRRWWPVPGQGWAHAPGWAR